MPVEAVCPACTYVVSADDDLAGKKGTCPRCKAKVRFAELAHRIRPSIRDEDEEEAEAQRPRAPAREKSSSGVMFALGFGGLISLAAMFAVGYALGGMGRRPSNNAQSAKPIAESDHEEEGFRKLSLADLYQASPPPLKLLMLEKNADASLDDPRVAGYREQLRVVRHLFPGETDESIVELTAIAVNGLREQGHEANPREILEVFTYFVAGTPNRKPFPRGELRGDLKAYCIFRSVEGGKPHTWAALSFHALYRATAGVVRGDN